MFTLLGGGGWGHPQGGMHMVGARLGCQKAMVGTGWTLDPWIGLENTTLRWFISDKESYLGSEQVYDNREC